jgi:hypothetical protein
MWRSIDGDWQVIAVPADESDPTSGERYRVTHEGRTVAEVSTFTELAHLVPLHLLVEHDDPA